MEVGDVRAVVFDLETADGWRVHEEGWLEVTRVEASAVAELRWHAGDGTTWLVTPSGARPADGGPGDAERAWRLVGMGFFAGGLPFERIVAAAVVAPPGGEAPPPVVTPPGCDQVRFDGTAAFLPRGQGMTDLTVSGIPVPDLPVMTALLGAPRCIAELHVQWTAKPVLGRDLRRLRRGRTRPG